MISKDLQGLAVPLTMLSPDPHNARKHSEANIVAIMRSLELFGQCKPIVILENGEIIAGNGTYQAARELGWKELAASKFADPQKAKAYAIADNKTADLAQWDKENLPDILADLQTDFDLVADFGFTAKDLDVAFGTPPDPNEEGNKLISCPSCGHEFVKGA